MSLKSWRSIAAILALTLSTSHVLADPGPWKPPLSTRGRYIVDADGNRFKLMSGNWHGASGTWNGSGDINDPANHHGGEKADQMPLGLARATIDEIIDGFAVLGINSIRLPFSNEMIHDARAVPTASVAANPELIGRTPLQVYDAVVQKLTSRNFAVILNNHTTTSRWCCAVDGNERWNTSQSAAQWQADWLFMVNRYKSNKRVVGVDLYNEVRRNTWDDPNWGWGNEHDWQMASQRVADRIQLEANPDVLIIVEGINWQGVPLPLFPHGRPTLEPARGLSHTLIDSGKLVYSAHFYAYTGPNHTGAAEGTAGDTADPRYEDLTSAQLVDTLYRQAFFAAAEGGAHFTAPVWISEFGVGGRGNNVAKSRSWFGRFVDYLILTDADFAIWPLVGYNAGDGWALLFWDADGQFRGLYDGDDWRASHWSRLISSVGATGQVARPATWDMLNLDYADSVQSRRMRTQPDWSVGARKGVCPDGQRLLGLSHTGNRGLCSDIGAKLSWTAAIPVRDQAHVVSDWAVGYTKVQCPVNHAVVGYSAKGTAFYEALCAQSTIALGQVGRSVKFDTSDSRPPDAQGGDFAIQKYKGQCAGGEYIAGIAYKPSGAKTPAVLLCRKL